MISIVVPVYNEEASLPLLLDEITHWPVQGRQTRLREVVAEVLHENLFHLQGRGQAYKVWDLGKVSAHSNGDEVESRRLTRQPLFRRVYKGDVLQDSVQMAATANVGVGLRGGPVYRDVEAVQAR